MDMFITTTGRRFFPPNFSLKRCKLVVLCQKTRDFLVYIYSSIHLLYAMNAVTRDVCGVCTVGELCICICHIQHIHGFVSVIEVWQCGQRAIEFVFLLSYA